jgi:hypothetical protein
MVVPGGLLGGEGPLPDPRFSYTLSRIRSCSGRHAVDPSISAEVRFEGLPAFACITDENLKSVFPGIGRVQGTDGVRPYWYYGKVTEEYGLLVDFGNVFEKQCSVGVFIQQNENLGKRFTRAYSKFQACLQRRFTEPPFKANDIAFCGIAQSWVEKE